VSFSQGGVTLTCKIGFRILQLQRFLSIRTSVSLSGCLASFPLAQFKPLVSARARGQRTASSLRTLHYNKALLLTL
jgi:hypothetical protein